MPEGVTNTDHETSGVQYLDPDRIRLRFAGNTDVTLWDMLDSGVPIDPDTEDDLELELVLLFPEQPNNTGNE